MSTTAEDLSNLDPAFLDESSDEYTALENPPDLEATDDISDSKQDEESASSGAEEGKPDTSGEQAAEVSGDEPENTDKTIEAQGVLSPDGKHIIPYTELKATRQQVSDERKAREEAEQRAQELAAEVEALKAGENTQADDGQETPSTTELTERLTALKEDFPELGEFLEQQQKVLDSTTNELNDLKMQREQELAARAS